jgi:hypothetical protein
LLNPANKLSESDGERSANEQVNHNRIKRKTELKQWFSEQYQTIEIKFDKYLKFGKIL